MAVRMRAGRWSSVALVLVSATALAEAPAATDGGVTGSAGGATVRRVTAIEELSLDELLDVETTVATRKARKARDAAAIITVFTREEIQATGVRDLAELLALVPGFSFGSDVCGSEGVGFRGLWGNDGKVLFMIDGQQLNELMYSSVPLGNRVMLDAVDRVEIIRGPGSAIYGGNAEFAVVNVVTQSASQVNGASATAQYGTTAKAFTSRSLSVNVGKQDLGVKDLGVSLAATLGQGNRSDREFVDYYGGSYSLTGDTGRLDPAQVNGAITWRGASLRVLYENYGMTFRDGFGEVVPAALTQNFRTFGATLQAPFEVTDRVKVTPKLAWLSQEPWRIDDTSYGLHYRKSVSRALAGITAEWAATNELDLLLGVEAHQDVAKVGSYSYVGTMAPFANGAESVSYQNLATFAQVLWDTPVVNVSAGGRFEVNSAYGSSFVPRVGLTRTIDRFHAKLLYSQAFRAPCIEAIRLSPDIKPERVNTLEAELGYQLNDLFYVGVNLFDVTLDGVNVYTVDALAGTEGYVNGPLMGSRGVEAELRFKHAKGWATLSYSFATQAGRGGPDTFLVAGNDAQYLGLPMHKVALHGSWVPMRGLSIGPSLVFYSERYGYLTGDADGNPVLGVEPAALLVNLFVNYDVAPVKGLNVGLGVNNLLDQNVRLLQPYNGGHAPMPVQSREVFARLTYRFGLD